MKRKIYFISILITVGGGAAVYFLSSIPFGLFFKLSAMTFFIGCLSTFLTLSISLLKSKLLWKKILCIPVIFLFLITGFVAGILVADNASGYTRLANTFLSIVPENSKAAFTKFPYSLTTEEWEKDIQYLKEELPKHHAYPFLYMQQEEFNNAIAQLESKLDKLSDKEISFEICRIVSMIKDGHTQVISIVFGMPAFLDTRLFPLRIFFFNDGVYVTDGGRDYKELEGLRITQIGSTKMEDIIKKINPYVPGENDYYKMQWAFPYLLNSGLLKYTGIIDDESARFIFKDASGKEVKKTISPVLSMQYLHWFRETLSLDDISRKGNQKKNYWYEYDKNTRTVFLQVNQVNNQQGSPSIKDFATELNDFINRNEVQKFIVDTRSCNGGDNSTMGPLVNLLCGNSKINQYGVLFTLIGRQTFSAGISFVSSLERNTKTILVGEPSGSGPNQCGDVQTFMLPNSKLVIQVSSKYHQQSFAKDHRLQITPTLPVQYSYKSWKENIDPAVAIINDYKIAAENNFLMDTMAYSSFTGRYNYDSDKTLTIKNESGKLLYEVMGYKIFARNDLYALSSNSFTANNGLVSLRFSKKKGNQFQKVYLKWGAGIDTLMRLQDSYQSLPEMINEGKFIAAFAAYRQAKSEGVVFPASTEAEINTMGYKLVEENKIDDAIQLFALNTELFPFSGNAWDSFAEAWLKKGDKIKAKLFYSKSLEMNPENKGAKEALNSL